ncbi:FadR/GntR family transcriptional regulator [Mangrovibrevibacter kandeliae]|uniref:FadR/GntR family transcriptional regulator n=1 Tax=Mangrovibrevibacter kandeliae TaxID=2968473 RepID=UPI00211943F9|nr:MULTISPECIES: FadR/GntR family transcriptional regulator [unclassified Aurantimonas]MCQ8783073.1 FadR family transcriptional regulator [Aurantimonas sp. CSK15Z-1]MCW4115737.1 FadR family transcriptional regulator [Aurantimonas sp. MSK8Z-1]
MSVVSPNPSSSAPRPRPRVGRDFVAALARAIVDGRYPDGSTLPREQDLGAEFSVSRTVVREALKTLESKGVVRSRPRAGTLVRARSEWNLLDADLLDWMGDAVVDDDLLASVLEARRAIEPVAAEVAAERASLADISSLYSAWEAMRDAPPGDDPAFTAADAEFHRILLRASGNRVFVQLSDVIDAALTRALDRSNRSVRSHLETVEIHRQLVEALRLRDKAAARRSSEKMLELAARDLERMKLRKPKG